MSNWNCWPSIWMFEELYDLKCWSKRCKEMDFLLISLNLLIQLILLIKHFANLLGKLFCLIFSWSFLFQIALIDFLFKYLNSASNWVWIEVKYAKFNYLSSWNCLINLHFNFLICYGYFNLASTQIIKCGLNIFNYDNALTGDLEHVFS